MTKVKCIYDSRKIFLCKKDEISRGLS